MKQFVRSVLDFADSTLQSMFSLALVAVYSKPCSLPALSSRKECVVLGNGPSLRKDVRSRAELGDRDVICVNDFVLSSYYELLKPDAYVVNDPSYWHDDLPDEVAAARAARHMFFEQLDRKTTWPIVLHVPFECLQSQIWKNRLQNDKIMIRGYNRTPLSGFRSFRHWLYRKNLGMPWAQNVMVAATFLAVNIGYRRVILLGADHSWHEEIEIGKDCVLYLKQEHFYDADAPRVPVFKGDMKTPFSMWELFEAWTKVFRGYMLVSDYARSVGTVVENATSRTFIDAFPRIEVAELQPNAVNANVVSGVF